MKRLGRVLSTVIRAQVLVVLTVCALFAGGVYAVASSPQDNVATTPRSQPAKETSAASAAPTPTMDAANASAPVSAPAPVAPVGKPKQPPAPIVPVAPAGVSAITITQGDDLIVRFRSVGKSATGYSAHWRLTSAPTAGQATSGIFPGQTLIQRDKSQNVWEGSVLMMNLKFATGSYALYVCENLTGGCGVMSNTIYLDITAITECTAAPYAPHQTVCLIKDTKFTYRF